jgi:hypothetical protein
MTDALSPLSQSVTTPAAAATAGEVLGAYLTAQAGAFLRALPPARGEAGGRPGEAAVRTDELLRAVRRIGGTLHTFDPVVDPGWAQELREELRWLLGILTQEPACNRRLAQLLAALDSLSGIAPPAIPVQRGEPEPPGGVPGMLAAHPGIPKARALLERQLSLARSRIHTSTLQELRSARLHALADRMTLLTGELPLAPPGASPAAEVLLPYAVAALRALSAAAEELPLLRAAVPYNGDALHRLRDTLTVPDRDAAGQALAADDAPWLRVRILAKRARYALEVCRPLLGGRAAPTAARLEALGRLLDHHQEAADAADTASTAARTPRITPATAYVLGVVHADQRLEVEAARHALGRQWPELTRAGWHDWATR